MRGNQFYAIVFMAYMAIKKDSVFLTFLHIFLWGSRLVNQESLKIDPFLENWLFDCCFLN